MKDGKYLTAKDKERVVRQFERFVSSGFKKILFTRAIYEELHLHQGFIAHYNQAGFYDARFSDPDGRIETIKRLVSPDPWRFNNAENGDLSYAIHRITRENFDKLMSAAVEYKKASLQLRIAGLKQELKRTGV